MAALWSDDGIVFEGVEGGDLTDALERFMERTIAVAFTRELEEG